MKTLLKTLLILLIIAGLVWRAASTATAATPRASP